MKRELQKKKNELEKALSKMLKEKIKAYKFKKKDYMIWFNKGDLFFDLQIDVGVTADERCLCNTVETIKPLWLDELLWDFLEMESNKEQPMSLRSIGAFTVHGSELYSDSYELENWDVAELEACVDKYLEHFKNTIDNADINTYLDNIKTNPYHLELREALTLVHNEQYLEAYNYLKDKSKGRFKNGDIHINDSIREHCKEKLEHLEKFYKNK